MQVRKTNQAKSQKISGWDAAIELAEKKIRRAEGQLKQLRVAIRTFQANKNAGIKWPTM
jgi:hypothetical protein